MADTPIEESLQYSVGELVREIRRGRRWKIFFKLTAIAISVVLLIILMMADDDSKIANRHKNHIALIDIQGMIMSGERGGADDFVTALRQAYDNPNMKTVVLRINSPGGSPVQASYIYNEINRMRTLHKDIKIYAVCTDLCASAAYYIAAATDKIYANPSSMVGSIGVLLNGFGFVGTLDKLGVERRLMTAGENKGFLDAFSPLKSEHKEKIQTMLDQVHQQFINAVVAGRGNRLKKNHPELFSGLVWTGEEAKTLGIIDDFGSVGSVSREVIHNENIVNYTLKNSYFERFADQFGKASVQQLGLMLGVGNQPQIIS